MNLTELSTKDFKQTLSNLPSVKPYMLGDNRDLVPLLPISNRTVKRVIADDSVGYTMRK